MTSNRNYSSRKIFISDKNASATLNSGEDSDFCEQFRPIKIITERNQAKEDLFEKFQKTNQKHE